MLACGFVLKETIWITCLLSTIFSWLRRRWNSSPVVITGAEDEEYRLTIADIDSSLVFMYTPVTEEGAKGEPQYKYTDFVKAGSWAKSVYNLFFQL